MTGARSQRIARVTEVMNRAYSGIADDLLALTREAHQGATFHTSRQALESCWYATPFVQTRDSDSLDKSNFHVIKNDLVNQDDEGVQIERFGHWGCGWFERIYVRRDHPIAISLVAAWLTALDQYPVADDDHYSETEWDDNHPGDGMCYSDDDDCGCDLRKC